MIERYCAIGSEVMIGYDGESNARELSFGLGKWRQAWPEATPTMIVQRAGDTEPYPVVTTMEGDTIKWVVSRYDAAKVGSGMMWVAFVNEANDDVGITPPTQIIVKDGPELIDGDTPENETPPWIQQAIEAAMRIEETAEQIPQTIEAALQEAKSSGEFDGEDGKDGYTPQIALERVEDGVQVTVINEDGEDTETIWDGTRDVYIASPGTLPAEIIAEAEKGKACFAAGLDGALYAYAGMEYAPGEGKEMLTFRRALVFADNKLSESVVRIDEDGRQYTYGPSERKIVSPEKMMVKQDGKTYAYDGSSPLTVEIPGVLIVPFRANEACASGTYGSILGARESGKAVVAVNLHNGSTYSYLGVAKDRENPGYAIPTFERIEFGTDSSIEVVQTIQIGNDNVARYYWQSDKGVANPHPLKLTGAVTAEYDGSAEVAVTIPEEIFVVRFTPNGDCDKTYSEISSAIFAGKPCIAINTFGNSVLTCGGHLDSLDDPGVGVPTFSNAYIGTGTKVKKVEIMQIGADNVVKYRMSTDKGIANPKKLTINGMSYDGSEAVDLTISGGTGGGSGLPEPEGAHMALVTDKDGKWSQVERLAYPITGTVEVWPETSPTYNEDEGGFFFVDPLPADIVIGNNYIVTCNGTEYACTATSVSSGTDEDGNEMVMPVLGNRSVTGEGDPDTGEPFLIVYMGAKYQSLMGVYGMMMTNDGATEATVSITAEGTTYKKVSFDYLPEGVGGVESGVVLSEVMLAVSEDSDGTMPITDPLKMPIVGGGQYTVLWNGTEYKCVAQELSEDGFTMILTGNVGAMVGGAGTGEPFVIMTMPGGIGEDGVYGSVIPLDGSTTVTLSISGETIKKIDPKYLGLEWVPEMQDVGEEILPMTASQGNNYSVGYSIFDKLSVGMRLIVYADGERFETTVRAPNASTQYLLGNGGDIDGIDADMPFAVITGGESTLISYVNGDDDTAHIMSIYAIGNVAQIPNPVPDKYLPAYHPLIVRTESEFPLNVTLREICNAFWSGRPVYATAKHLYGIGYLYPREIDVGYADFWGIFGNKSVVAHITSTDVTFTDTEL